MSKTNNVIVNKINELYIMGRQKYLLQKKNGEGEYVTLQVKNKQKREEEDMLEECEIMFGFTDKKRSKKNRVRPLSDWMIEEHLQGNKGTYGVFAGKSLTKFLCFDVDVPNMKLSKWITYKTIQAIQEIGIPNDYIHVSSSGNKGYHVEIFFMNPIRNEVAYELYNIIMQQAGFEQEVSEKYAYNCYVDRYDTNEREHVGQVEYRPRFEQGLKLPLGIHQKTKRRCWFVNRDTLKPIKSKEYILKIKQIDNEIIRDILDEQVGISSQELQQIEKAIEYIEGKYQPLETYQKNIDTNATIEESLKLLEEGLKYKGTRHNSLMKLAKYFKYTGLDRAENEQALIHWMSEQDTRTYTTAWNMVLEDIQKIVLYIYENDINLTIQKEYIIVSIEEMRIIIQAKTKNQMLLLYSMLVHMKRYGNLKGIFYMSQRQMEKTTGLTEKTIRNLLPKLEEQGLLEYIKRNQKQKGTYLKKVNHYVLPLFIELNILESEKTIEVKLNDKQPQDNFKICILNLIPLDELKQKVPRRMYDEFKVIVS